MAVKWNTKKIEARLRRELIEAAVEGAELIRAKANKAIMSPPKTGVVYYRKGKPHQASAPGEAPANWTGKLIKSSRVVRDWKTLSASAQWRADYSLHLEYGTEKMEPRPFIRPATIALKKTITKLMAAATKRALKK